MMEKFKALGLENVHIDRGGNVVGLRRRKRQRTEGIDRGSFWIQSFHLERYMV